MEKFLNKFRIKYHDFQIWWLDKTAPFFSILTQVIFKKYWISRVSRSKYKLLTTNKLKHENLKNIFFDFHQADNLWQSTLFTFFIVLILPIVIIMFFGKTPSISIKNNMISSSNISFLETSWQILASIIGITFVIIIFLAEISSRDKYGRMSLPVFLNETWLVFTGTFGLLSIFSNGIAIYFIKNNILHDGQLFILYYFQLIILGINIILILRIFLKTIRLFPKSTILLRTNSYLRRVVSNSIQTEIIERMQDNLLNSEIGKMDIEFPFFPPDKYVNGTYVNLNLDEFKSYKIADVNPKILKIATNNAKKIHKRYEKNDIKFFAKFRFQVSKENPGIALINPLLDHPSIYKYLINSIKIKEVITEKQPLYEEFMNYGDMLFKALTNNDVDNVSLLLDLNIELIDLFMEIFHSYNIELRDSPLTVNWKYFSDWKLVDKITDQYRNLISHFLIFHDDEIVNKFLNLPISIMGKCLIYKDVHIYQKFLNLCWQVYISISSNKYFEKEKSLRDILFFRLRDHRLYYLNPRLRHAKEDYLLVKKYKDFYFNLLVNWNKFLKKSIDNFAIDDYFIFIKEANEVNKSFLNEITNSKIEILKINKKIVDNDIEKQKIEIQLNEKLKLLKEKQELENLFNMMICGLSSWIIYLYENSKLSSEKFFQFMKINDLFIISDEKFFDLYMLKNQYSLYGEHLQWDYWELEESTDIYNGFSSLKFHFSDLLDRFFVIRSLEIIKKNPKVDFNFPLNNELDDYLTNLNQICLNIEKSESIIDYFIKKGINYQEVSSYFFDMIKNAKTQINTSIKNKIIAASIDEEVTKTIIDETMDTWRYLSVIRSLVNKFGTIQNEVNLILYHKHKISFSQLLPKEVFIKQDRIQYLSMSLLGEGISQLEDKKLYNNIYENSLKTSMKLQEIEVNLINTLFEMEQNNIYPFIFVKDEKIIENLEKSPNFISGWKIKNNPLGNILILGTFEDHPVLVLNSMAESQICLLDINEFGILRQYLPDYNRELIVDISEFSLEEAKKIVENQPSNKINPITGKKFSKDEQITNQLLQVKVEVSEAFRFVEINSRAVRIFSII